MDDQAGAAHRQQAKEACRLKPIPVDDARD